MSNRLAILFGLALATGAGADDGQDTLYQVSTIDALLAGVYQPLARIGEALEHGDFGLGTFEALDGELILLDGQVYQATSDGEVRRVSPDMGTPFIAVTRFAADLSLTIPPHQSYAAFKDWLEAELPSRNLVYAIRVEGSFDRISFRSVPRQEPPYPPLIEVSKQQTLFERRDIRGTLLGFWCPAFTKGVNVPGFHLHFLSADRRHAGHVLDFTLAAGETQLDLTNGWDVVLPMSPAFLDADLGEDRSAALHRVEQAKSGRQAVPDQDEGRSDPERARDGIQAR